MPFDTAMLVCAFALWTLEILDMVAYSQIVQARSRKPELELRIVKLFNFAYYTIDFPKSGYLRPVECVSEPNSPCS